jgi:hypothetical protein
MDLLNLLGLGSFLLTIIALHLLGMPNRKTFPIFIVSILMQAWIFYSTKQWFLLAQMAVLMGYNIRNWIEWKKKEIG